MKFKDFLSTNISLNESSHQMEFTIYGEDEGNTYLPSSFQFQYGALQGDITKINNTKVEIEVYGKDVKRKREEISDKELCQLISKHETEFGNAKDIKKSGKEVYLKFKDAKLQGIIEKHLKELKII